MKKKIFSLCLFGALLFSLSSSLSEASAQVITHEGQMMGQVEETSCYDAWGHFNGYSNDCVMGNGACVDRDC